MSCESLRRTPLAVQGLRTLDGFTFLRRQIPTLLISSGSRHNLPDGDTGIPPCTKGDLPPSFRARETDIAAASPALAYDSAGDVNVS